jgi:hypothetical protein
MPKREYGTPLDPVSLESLGLPGYFATREGRVWTQRPEGFQALRPYIHSQTGKLRVRFARDRNKFVSHQLDRLILTAFGQPLPGARPRKYGVKHKNGNEADCHLENLEWAKKTSPRERAIKRIKRLMIRYGITAGEL